MFSSSILWPCNGVLSCTWARSHRCLPPLTVSTFQHLDEVNLEGEYGLFFGQGAFLEAAPTAQAAPTSVLPQRQRVLECPLLYCPKAGIQPSQKELEVGTWTGVSQQPSS